MAFHPIRSYVDGRVNAVLEEKGILTDTVETIYFDEEFYQKVFKLFYVGDTAEIVRWFKSHFPKKYTYKLNYFYRVVNSKTLPIQHYPLANIVSKTMANLVFTDNPIFTLSSEELTKKLNDMYDENELGTLLQKACEYESYSGAVAFKPVIDQEFSEYPILIPYAKEDVEVVREYGRITEILFRDIYDRNDRQYLLYTICGKGYIDYKLYIKKAGTSDKGREVPLTEIDETKDLKPIKFKYSDGRDYDKIVAIYKENRTNAESDYKNLIDDFAALDEIYSNMTDFIRRSRIKTYMPETFLQEDIRTGKRVEKDEYDTDNVILHDSNPKGTTQEVKRDTIDISGSVQGYKEAFENVLLHALATVGLSPATIGMDISGANSSALALNIRERVSLRTRSEKQKRWLEALQKLSILMLELSTVRKAGDDTFIVDEVDDVVDIQFAEYETPSFSEQVDVLSKALDAGLIDKKTALKQLYPDMDDETIDEMLANIQEDSLALIKQLKTTEVPDEQSERPDSEDKDTERV